MSAGIAMREVIIPKCNPVSDSDDETDGPREGDAVAGPYPGQGRVPGDRLIENVSVDWLRAPGFGLSGLELERALRWRNPSGLRGRAEALPHRYHAPGIPAPSP